MGIRFIAVMLALVVFLQVPVLALCASHCGMGHAGHGSRGVQATDHCMQHAMGSAASMKIEGRGGCDMQTPKKVDGISAERFTVSGLAVLAYVPAADVVSSTQSHSVVASLYASPPPPLAALTPLRI